jgi:hypothetical protein
MTPLASLRRRDDCSLCSDIVEICDFDGVHEMPTMRSRKFNQDVGRAKRAANLGPVVITDRGRPAYVLMRHETDRRLAGQGLSIRAVLAHPERENVPFEPPHLDPEPPQLVAID